MVGGVCGFGSVAEGVEVVIVRLGLTLTSFMPQPSVVALAAGACPFFSRLAVFFFLVSFFFWLVFFFLLEKTLSRISRTVTIWGLSKQTSLEGELLFGGKLQPQNPYDVAPSRVDKYLNCEGLSEREFHQWTVGHTFNTHCSLHLCVCVCVSCMINKGFFLYSC